MLSNANNPAEQQVGFSDFRPGPVLIVLISLNVLIEFTLQAADHGLLGSPLWRGAAYHNAAFWAGLLDNWRPNYQLQPAVMFLSYAFLHGGFWHLFGNVLVLVFLGIFVRQRAGQGGLLTIYLVSGITGGAGFALLGESYQPMVGASGALFGLAGALKTWEWKDRLRLGLSTWPVWRDVIGLALLNLLLWYIMDGLLAWEAHLGGFIGGAAVATVIGNRVYR